MVAGSKEERAAAALFRRLLAAAEEPDLEELERGLTEAAGHGFELRIEQEIDDGPDVEDGCVVAYATETLFLGPHEAASWTVSFGGYWGGGGAGGGIERYDCECPFEVNTVLEMAGICLGLREPPELDPGLLEQQGQEEEDGPEPPSA